MFLRNDLREASTRTHRGRRKKKALSGRAEGGPSSALLTVSLEELAEIQFENDGCDGPLEGNLSHVFHQASFMTVLNTTKGKGFLTDASLTCPYQANPACIEFEALLLLVLECREILT